MQPSRDVRRLIEIMAALRDPVAGCPWDVEQTFASIAPFTIEEAYEVADAIERGATEDLREELGDLLLQVVFHARMAEEAGMFDFGGVVEAITAKLVRRHPHVFGDARELNSSAVKALWGRIKADEKRAKLELRRTLGCPRKLRWARSAAFPWRCRRFLARRNCRREPAKSGSTGTMCARFSPSSARRSPRSRRRLPMARPQTLSGEVGDLLFTAVNLARHLKVDPEAALRGANAKFERRFAHIESRLAEDGRTPESASLDEMESLWAEAKAHGAPGGMSGSE